jgi:hypothetical protein
MYRRMLIPLDSKTAEKILPYARCLAGKVKLLSSVVDLAEMCPYIR